MSQLADASAVATSATCRPARRAESAASTGTLATAKSAEARRRAVAPPPRWTTSHATRKWSGAPPRSVCTVWKSPPRRIPADEERERLVLVGRPLAQARQQERAEPEGARRDPEREPALGEHDSQAVR